MDENHEVRLHLDGPEGQIEVGALLNGAASLMELLRQPRSEARWVVSDLSLGSLDVAVRPAGVLNDDDIRQVVDLDAALTAFAEPDRVPANWDRAKSHALLAIARLTSTSRVTGVVLTIGAHSHALDEQMERHVEQTLRSPTARRSLGSVRGIVKRYNGTKHEVGIVDTITGRSVTARFAAALMDQVIGAIEHEVIAWGDVTRDASGRKVDLYIRDLEPVEPSTPPVPVEEMIGIYGPDWIDGMSPEEWVRRQREQ